MSAVAIDDELVRAAQTYARTRVVHAANQSDATATTAHNLAAHTFAALMVDRVLDADAAEFLADLRSASAAMMDAQRQPDRRRARR